MSNTAKWALSKDPEAVWKHVRTEANKFFASIAEPLEDDLDHFIDYTARYDNEYIKYADKIDKPHKVQLDTQFRIVSDNKNRLRNYLVKHGIGKYDDSEYIFTLFEIVDFKYRDQGYGAQSKVKDVIIDLFTEFGIGISSDGPKSIEYEKPEDIFKKYFDENSKNRSFYCDPNQKSVYMKLQEKYSR